MRAQKLFPAMFSLGQYLLNLALRASFSDMKNILFTGNTCQMAKLVS
jgi:hypothetical protein